MAEIVPIDPVVPAIRQFDAVDVLKRTFRRDLHCEGVRFTRSNPRRHVELVSDVHADNLLVVRDQVAVQPDFAAVIDSREIQEVGRAVGGRGERGAVPPILLVEVLGHFVAKVHPGIQLRVETVLPEDLEDGRRHAVDLVPGGGVVVLRRQSGAVRGEPSSGGQRPIVRQLKLFRRIRRNDDCRVRTRAQQQRQRDEDLDGDLQHAVFTPWPQYRLPGVHLAFEQSCRSLFRGGNTRRQPSPRPALSARGYSAAHQR